tara:strand:- start:389 stop:1057 length:669 start_codon:yes stop_codon:yes gene_type:complete
MLIIAIPKSASTSLLATLKKVHRLDGRQTYFPDAASPSEVKVLDRYHSDLRELNEEQVDAFSDKKSLYKQHIPPTENNIKLLQCCKKVILLRPPEDIISAYYRAEMNGIHAERPEFIGCRSIEEWQRRAREIGLYDDLMWFTERWRTVPDLDGDNLFISCEELLSSPLEVINRVEAHFVLPVSVRVELEKARYSRHGKVRRFAISAKGYIKKCLKYALGGEL